ncbi:methyltransferase type 11 [Mesorhizobium kowhaii]|uniref:Methyltransferase type 11 n=2 Tax=Mesorhizobium kowhaii TaxID=1300272 RepID=A0A2W7C964_9HYPH|nr:methyltransferase type 11 [Mesorhizobium kowhaii]
MIDPVYRHAGRCPVCEQDVEFRSASTWYRDFLVCSGCGSIPRERAIAHVLSESFAAWRRMSIHESSPSDRGISRKLSRQCTDYIATQFFPEMRLGSIVSGFRNENLEAQTFDDQRFDLVITLDVMEHVNQPESVLKEVARTLKPGGAYVFTVPTYKGKTDSERRALYKPDGSIDHLVPEPEYHGNPISDSGSLVTFHYGYDLPERIYSWSAMDVEVRRFHDHHFGIIGDFTEVYICRKLT